MKKLSQCLIVAIFAACAFSSAYAAWQCKSIDRRGIYWFGEGYNQRVAANRALRSCSDFSRRPRSCAIQLCHPGVGPHNGNASYPQPNRWQCTAGNIGAVGTGPTQSNAAADARDRCLNRTNGTGGCQIKGCFIRRL